MNKILINFSLFQVAWFACALGAGNDAPELSIAVVLIVLATHLLLSHNRQRDLQFIIFVAIIGTTTDSILGWFGILRYDGQWFCPLWLTGLWMAFASTIYYSLSWLKNRLLLSSLLGAIAGPLSYYAGYKFGALQLSNNLLLSIIILAGIWSLILPLLIIFSSLNTRALLAR